MTDKNAKSKSAHPRTPNLLPPVGKSDTNFRQFVTTIASDGPVATLVISTQDRREQKVHQNPSEAIDYISKLRDDPNVCSIFVGLNRLKSGTTTRRKDDVIRRCWLLIDVDSERPKGRHATSTEKQEAKNVCIRAFRYLTDQQWPCPIICDSGNGYHLLYRIDLPSDQDSEILIKTLLQNLAQRFDTAGAKVDRIVFDAARTVRVAGTINRKNPKTKTDDGEPCPHRQTCYQLPKAGMQIVAPEQIQQVLDKLCSAAVSDDPPPKKKQIPRPRERVTPGSVNLERPVTTPLNDAETETLDWYCQRLDKANIHYVRCTADRKEIVSLTCPCCNAPAEKKKCRVAQGNRRLVVRCVKCGGQREGMRRAMHEKGIPWVSPAEDTEQRRYRVAREVVYQRILSATKLSEKHHDDMRTRGFSDDQIAKLMVRSGYKLSAVVYQSVDVAAQVVGDALGEKLTKQDATALIKMVPGVCLLGESVALRPPIYPGLLLPQRNSDGGIERLQLRCDHPGDGAKYRFVGAANERVQISGVHVPLHTRASLPDHSDQAIIVTEGILKADMTASWHPAVGMQGVNRYDEAIRVVRALGGTRVRWAFDADHREKKAVAQAVIDAVAMCQRERVGCSLLVWSETHKGIDDLPADQRCTIVDLTGAKLYQYIEMLAAKHGISLPDCRARIQVTADNAARAVEQILDTLGQQGYLRRPDGRIAMPDPLQPDTAALCVIDERQFVSQVERYVLLQRRTPTGSWESTKLTQDMASRAYHRIDYSGLPRILHFLTGPGVRPDGQLIVDPGYDSTSGVYVSRVPANWNPGQHICRNPTRDQAHQAYGSLAELFAEFPFSTPREPSIAALVGLMLTVIGRHRIGECVPAYLIAADRPGSGKTLLAQVCGRIACGGDVPTTRLPTDDTQVTYDLTTQMLAGRALTIYDNIAESTRVDWPSLAQALTSRRWRARGLRTENDIELDNLMTIIMTGNGIGMSGELARRTLAISLDPQTKNRFRLGDLADHVKRRDAELLGHLLTIWRWIEAHYDQVRQDAGNIRSFTAYRRWVVCPLHDLAGQDITTLLATANTQINAEVDERSEILTAIHTVMRRELGAWWRANDLLFEITKANRSRYSGDDAVRYAADNLITLLGIQLGRTNSVSVGRALGSHVDQPCNGRVLRRRSQQGRYHYRVECHLSAPIPLDGS